MKNKISVIVPIYKVEQYLNRCVESIVNQTYKNLEIILVDDGSPDLCPKICDEWAEKDSRIVVIHKENSGLSDARNAGLKVATGGYVAFVDSDDIINPFYVEYLYKAICDNDAQISACDLKNFYDEKEIGGEDIHINSAELCDSEEALYQLIKGKGVRAVACNKMYKAELLDGEQFIKGKFHEDEFFTYRILHKAKRIAYLDYPLYYYRQRVGSIMTTVSLKHMHALDAFLERLDFLEANYPNLYKEDKVGICILCTMHYREALKNNMPESEEMKSYIRECRKRIKFTFDEMKAYSLYRVFYIVASGINIDLFSKILNLRKG